VIDVLDFETEGAQSKNRQIEKASIFMVQCFDATLYHYNYASALLKLSWLPTVKFLFG